MHIVLSHASALEYLRYYGSDPSSCLRTADRVPLLARCPRQDELEAMIERTPALQRLSQPLHVMVTDRKASRRTKLVHVHGGMSLPAGGLIAVASDVYCCPPESVTVQLAGQCTTVQLSMLAMELLGTYAIAPQSNRGILLRDAPLTTELRIREYLLLSQGLRGTAKVRDVLSLVKEGSASPMESRLCIRASWDFSLGGYELPVLSLNQENSIRRLGSHADCLRRFDIPLGFDGKALVDLEYNGEDHQTAEGMNRDLRRQNDLVARKIPSYAIGKEQYADIPYMNDLTETIRADLGLSPHCPGPVQLLQEREAQRRLCSELWEADGLTCFGLENAWRIQRGY